MKNGDGIIDKKRVKMFLNMHSKDYKNFVIAGISEEEKLFEDVYAGCILGKESFVKNKLKIFKSEFAGKEFAHQKDLDNGKIEIYDILEAVREYYKAPITDLTSRKQDFLPRKIAIYLSERITQKTNREIGKVFGVGDSAVGKISHDIEKLLMTGKNITLDLDLKKLISDFRV